MLSNGSSLTIALPSGRPYYDHIPTTQQHSIHPSSLTTPSARNWSIGGPRWLQESWNQNGREAGDIGMVKSATEEHYFTLDSTDKILLFGLLSLNTSVVGGNALVIMAVFTTKSLRSVNTLLITSLAVADILVGILVLPFSIVNEVFKEWIFGEVWCQMWLAVDVWMCTASIYNLVAISIDRYIAILKPLSYRAVVTMRRGQLGIGMAWFVSFAISCPPAILNWPEAMTNTPQPPTLTTKNLSAALTAQQQFASIRTSVNQCTPAENSPGYIMYSATGSFFLPMFIIVFIYVRIYLVARLATRQAYRGTLVIKSKCSVDHSDQMRIHKPSRSRPQSTAIGRESISHSTVIAGGGGGGGGGVGTIQSSTTNIQSFGATSSTTQKSKNWSSGTTRRQAQHHPLSPTKSMGCRYSTGNNNNNSSIGGGMGGGIAAPSVAIRITKSASIKRRRLTITSDSIVPSPTTSTATIAMKSEQQQIEDNDDIVHGIIPQYYPTVGFPQDEQSLNKSSIGTLETLPSTYNKRFSAEDGHPTAHDSASPRRSPQASPSHPHRPGRPHTPGLLTAHDSASPRRSPQAPPGHPHRPGRPHLSGHPTAQDSASPRRSSQAPPGHPCPSGHPSAHDSASPRRSPQAPSGQPHRPGRPHPSGHPTAHDSASPRRSPQAPPGHLHRPGRPYPPGHPHPPDYPQPPGHPTKLTPKRRTFTK